MQTFYLLHEWKYEVYKVAYNFLANHGLSHSQYLYKRIIYLMPELTETHKPGCDFSFCGVINKTFTLEAHGVSAFLTFCPIPSSHSLLMSHFPPDASFPYSSGTRIIKSGLVTRFQAYFTVLLSQDGSDTPCHTVQDCGRSTSSTISLSIYLGPSGSKSISTTVPLGPSDWDLILLLCKSFICFILVLWALSHLFTSIRLALGLHYFLGRSPSINHDHIPWKH